MAERVLPDWYPTSVNHVIDLETDPAPYGDVLPETMSTIMDRLQQQNIIGGRIVDIAGGYGRYAMPLARAGHNVTIIDIDPPHLAAADRNAATLSANDGELKTVFADVTLDKDIALAGNGYDLSLNVAFLYLAPPEQAKAIFERNAPVHKLGGIAVVQFSTNIVRKDQAGNVLKGDAEHSYSKEEGMQTLQEMFDEAGFGDFKTAEFTIHDEAPFYFHSDGIVASGICKR